LRSTPRWIGCARCCGGSRTERHLGCPGPWSHRGPPAVRARAPAVGPATRRADRPQVGAKPPIQRRGVPELLIDQLGQGSVCTTRSMSPASYGALCPGSAVGYALSLAGVPRGDEISDERRIGSSRTTTTASDAAVSTPAERRLRCLRH